ncbi:hypothetical protein M9458_032881, partial [Cirrhinus mrigala]
LCWCVFPCPTCLDLPLVEFFVESCGVYFIFVHLLRHTIVTKDPTKHVGSTMWRSSCDDVCLIEGFRYGLDDDLRFVMPHGDSCWTLQNYINFALWMNGSTFTVGEAEEDSNLVQPHLADVSQHDPEPSQPPPQLTEPVSEPTADGEPEPKATETIPMGATAQWIATEPEPSPSNQVCEPATWNAMADDSVEREGNSATVLQQEIANLLAKDAIEPVPPAEKNKGFYSPYYITNPRSSSVEMLTVRHMLTCVQQQDWFAAIDLKDAYFHVSILPRHRPFLQFAYERRAYQYKVLPFGLSLSPCVFTKITEAALTPLHEQGIRILNYLDDWLILAQSQ